MSKVISEEEQRRLIYESQNGSIEAKKIFIEKNSGLVNSIANKYRYTGIDIEDLKQVGFVAIILALETFDLSYENRFSTYAVPIIIRGMLEYINSNMRSFRITADFWGKYEIVNKEIEQYILKNGYEPSTKYLMRKTRLAEKTIRLIKNIDIPTLSIETSYLEDDSMSLEERITNSDPDISYLLECKSEVEFLIREANLTEEDKIILRYCYGLDESVVKTHTEIAEIFGVSHQMISAKVNGILRKLKAAYLKNFPIKEVSKSDIIYDEIANLYDYLINEGYGDVQIFYMIGRIPEEYARNIYKIFVVKEGVTEFDMGYFYNIVMPNIKKMMDDPFYLPKIQSNSDEFKKLITFTNDEIDRKEYKRMGKILIKMKNIE